MPNDADVQEPKQEESTFIRHENFESWYANNIQFFPSEWDLKVVFGEIDWPKGKMQIQQHTSMSISWLQAKIMQYFLTLHVGAYELSHGKISVPTTVLPIAPVPPTGDLANDPAALRLYHFVQEQREKFLASLK